MFWTKYPKERRMWGVSLWHRVSQQHSLLNIEFWGQWEKHCLNCLSLIKDDMELIYFFLVTRGFERLQEDHQDITFNIQKIPVEKKQSLQLGSISVTTKNQQYT